MYFNPYALPVFLAGLIMLVLALAALKYRRIPGIKYFSFLMLAGAMYSIFYALEISSHDLAIIKTFYRFEYLGIPLIPAFYILFSIHYTEKWDKLPPAYIITIFIIPLLTILMVFTNSHHQLFISNIYLNTEGLFPTLKFDGEIFYWLHQIYSIIAIILSFSIFLRTLIIAAPTFRRQYAILLIGASFPIVLFITYITGLFPYGLDPIPFSFAVSGLILLAGISRFELFKIAPVARNLLFEKIPHAVVVFDEHNRILDCNKAALSLLKIQPKEIGKKPAEIFKQQTDLINLLSQNHQDKDVVSLKSGNSTLYFERLYSQINDHRNQARGKMLILHDVTRQRLEEIKRREIEEKFTLIFENIPLGVLYFDRSATIRVCNDAFVSIMGSSRERLIGLNMLDLPDQRVVDAVKATLNGAKGTFEGDYHSVTGNKKSVVHVLFEAIHSETNEITGGIVIVEDIAERKASELIILTANEELKRINAEKDRFFSIIAHDLRSPFNAFLGYTELLTSDFDELSTSDIQDYANEIRRSALSLFGLLENLLEWARLQQNTLAMNQHPCNLFDLADSSIQVLSEVAQKKQVSIKNEINKTIVVNVYKKMILSVFRNLISNAIKFSPRGSEVVVSAKVSTGQMIEIQVSDRGVGISESDRSKLFRIDQKVNSPGTENEPSTGLGLILCQEFVEKHGGKIWAHSQKGKGSDFYFILPGNLTYTQ